MRERKPYFKSSHKCWYFRHHGTETRLDPDKDKAWKLWHEIVGGKRQVTKDTLVLDLINRFLDWSLKHHKPSTYGQHKEHLESFYRHIGKLRFSTLKQHHVTDWIDERYKAYELKHKKKTSPSTRHTAIKAVQRMLNWNRKQGWVETVPLFEKPTPLPRDTYLMPDEFLKLVGAIKDQAFLDYVTILRETGCRPLEARSVEAKHFKGDCWEFEAEDSKGGLESRVVLLNPRALAITRRLVSERPTGPLFLNQDGKPWLKDALGCRCYRLREKLKLPICCYAVRHTFATDAIIKGVDLISIARLMGHKDLRMLSRVYQHVQKRSDHLRAALLRATG